MTKSTLKKLCKLAVDSVRERYGKGSGKGSGSAWAVLHASIRSEIVDAATFGILRGRDGVCTTSEMDDLYNMVRDAFDGEIT